MDALRSEEIKVKLNLPWKELERLDKRIDRTINTLNRLNGIKLDEYIKQTQKAEDKQEKLTEDIKQSEQAHKSFGQQVGKTGDELDRLGKKGRKADEESRVKPATTSSYKSFGEAIGKAKNNMNSFMLHTRKAVKQSSIFNKALKGTMGVMTGYIGFNAIASGVGSITRELNESSKAWQTFRGNMKMNKHSDSDIEKTQSFLQDYAEKTIYSASDMASTYSQLDAVGTKHTSSLVKGLGGLAATAKDPAQAMKSLSMQMTQAAAQPKIQWEDLKIMLEQAPAGISMVAKKMGTSTDGLLKQVHAGKLATKDFLDAISKAGNSKGLQDMATKFKTVDQAADGLRETVANKLLGPFEKGSNRGIRVLSDLNDKIANIKDKDVDHMFNIAKSVLSIGKSIATGAWKAFSSTFNTIFSMLPGTHKGLSGIDDSLKEIAKHKKEFETFGKVLLGFFAVRKATQFAGAILKVAKNLRILKSVEVGSHFTGNAKTVTRINPALTKGAFKNAGVMGKVATGAVGAGVAISAGIDIYGAIKAKNPKKKFKKFGQGLGTAIGGGIGFFFGGPLGAALGASIGKVVGGWGGKSVRRFVDGWNTKGRKGKKPKAFLPKMGWYARNASDAVVSFVDSFNKKFGKYTKTIVDVLKSPITTFINWFYKDNSLYKSITNWISNAVGKAEKALGNMGKKLAKFFKPGHLVKAYATGGRIDRDQTALVGEKGFELVYGKHGSRMVGLNGPELTNLQAGDQVYNHEDSKRLTSNGFNKKIHAYEKGTTTLNTSNAGGKTPADVSDKTSKKVVKNYKDYTTKSAKYQKKLEKTNKKSWKSIDKDTTKNSAKMSKEAIKDVSYLSKKTTSILNDLRSQWSNIWAKMVSDFNKIFSRLAKYAQAGMSGAIRQVNRGLSGINSVLSQFGGGGSILKMAHYANGTGPVTEGHTAMVNDAQKGPRQEAIVKANGDIHIPKGNNRVVRLNKGDSVLNGTDFQTAQTMGVIPKYAKGKGSNEALKKLLKANSKKPNDAFDDEYSKNVQPIGSKFQQGIIKTTLGGSKKVGYPWSAEAWSQMNDATSGNADGSAAGGSWLHNPGGWSHTDHFGSGRSGGVHDGNDFSTSVGRPFKAVHGGKVVRAAMPPKGWGAVGYSIITKGDDGEYVMYQEFGHASDAKVGVGDIVKTGQVIGRLGNSGLGTGPHLHIGVSKNYPFSNNGMSTAGWQDLTKMTGTDDGSSKLKPKKKKASSALSKFVSKQLKGPLKWISKNLADEDADIEGASNPGGAGVNRWKPYIHKAAKEMGVDLQGNDVARILNTINHESGGDPKVWQHGYVDVNTGVDPARGLLQFIGSTFRHYAVKGHTNRASGYDQLLALFNDKNWRSDLRWNGGWGPSGGRRREHGGPVKKGEQYLVDEKGFEHFSPDTKTWTAPANGRINPHDQAVGKLRGGGNATINQNIEVTVNGNGNEDDIRKAVKEGADKANNNLFDQLANLWGFNDDGGLII